jgi:hypothetical protein
VNTLNHQALLPKKIIRNPPLEKKQHERTTGGLAIWRRDEYMRSFLFAIQREFQPTNNAEP